MHLYQESEGLESAEAFVSTATSFCARLIITATFVTLVVVLPHSWLVRAAIVWGLGLLGTLTILLARQRHTSVGRELVRHFAIAIVIIGISHEIGVFVSSHLT